MEVFLGVDVGSYSTRASIFSADGSMLAHSTRGIKVHSPAGFPGFFEQSSQDIWRQTCLAIRDCLSMNSEFSIVGIGFDATCSLVCFSDKGISIDPIDPDSEFDVIMWMDHRAENQAFSINCTNHEALNCVGGIISPEMQLPKILWIKEVMPSVWENVEKFFDLADYLIFRSTGVDARSLCCTTCKWNLSCNPGQIDWNRDFLNAIRLEDLSLEKIGNVIQTIGTPVGCGLIEESAIEMNLPVLTPVATGMIDAHSGGLGSLAGLNSDEFTCTMVIVSGTSSCHMISSSEKLFVNGVWGPYYSAMIPEMWLNEAGQSASGALLDFFVQNHPAYSMLKAEIPEGSSMSFTYQWLNRHLEEISEKKRVEISLLAKDIHILPDFHGNRSPIADPKVRGVIMGLSLDASVDTLAIQYLAVVQALAFGTRQILDSILNAGHKGITQLLMCGGLSHNSLFVQEHANITRCKVLLPTQETVLLGAAILGACASGKYGSIVDAMNSLGQEKIVHFPTSDSLLEKMYDAKYSIYLRLQQLEIDTRNTMASINSN